MNFFDQNNLQNLDNNTISNLVSELFNHITSKETFKYISDLLITSLSDYKKRFSLDRETENVESPFNKINKSESSNSRYGFNSSNNEYLSISNNIHTILSNCQDLTNGQKLDFCNNQRYFMKLYLKEIIIKINEKSLDH